MGDGKKRKGNGNGDDTGMERPIRRLLQDLEENPEDPAARLTQLGRLYNEALRWGNAADAFREAQRHNPNKTDTYSIHFGLGKALCFLGRRDDAINNLEEAVRLMPEDADAQLSLGVTCWEAGRHDEAEQALKEAVKLKPDNPAAHESLGTLWYGRERYEEAAEASRRAIALDPKDGDTHFLLGLSLVQLKRYQDAAKALKEAAELSPYRADAWYYLARTCHELKDREGAAAARRRLSPLDPVRAEELAAAEQQEQAMDAIVAAGGVVIMAEPDREEVEEDVSGTPKDRKGRWLKEVKSGVRYVDKSAPPEQRIMRWIGYDHGRLWGPRYLVCPAIPDDVFINLYRPLKPGAAFGARRKRWALWLRWQWTLLKDSLPGGSEHLERAKLRRSLRPPRGVDPDAALLLQPLKNGRHAPADVRPLYDTPGFWCVRVEA